MRFFQKFLMINIRHHAQSDQNMKKNPLFRNLNFVKHLNYLFTLLQELINNSEIVN